ncbi:MAG: oligosaccharide flippase family protein [Solirubrobacterales bacterium]
MSAPPGGLNATLRSSWRSPSRRNLFYTVGAGLLIQLMLVVTGPFLSRLLGPAGRGDLAALMIWPAVLIQLGGLGIPAAVTYFLSRGTDRRETIGLGLRFAGIQAVVLILLQGLVVVAVFASRSPEVHEAALISIAVIPGALAQEYGLALLQARGSLAWYSVLQVLPIALYVVAVVVLFVASAGLVPVVIAWVGTTASVGLATFAFAVSRTDALGRPTRERSSPGGREMLSFGLRGILSANSATDIVRPDQIALALFLPSRALGLYVVALAITNLPYFIAKAIGIAAFPAVARESEPSVARRAGWRYLWAMIGSAGVIVCVLFATASFLIPFFFGQEFHESVDLSYILLAGAFFTAVRRVGAECMRGRGQPGAGTTAEIAAVIWLLATLAVLLPVVGVTGAAIGLASSQLTSFLVLAAIAARRGELHHADAAATLRVGLAQLNPAAGRYRR